MEYRKEIGEFEKKQMAEISQEIDDLNTNTYEETEHNYQQHEIVNGLSEYKRQQINNMLKRVNNIYKNMELSHKNNDFSEMNEQPRDDKPGQINAAKRHNDILGKFYGLGYSVESTTEQETEEREREPRSLRTNDNEREPRQIERKKRHRRHLTEWDENY